MMNVKILKNPGYLYDLQYLFYLHFNQDLCMKEKHADAEHLQAIMQYFGEIPSELYVFYHAISNGRCMMTTHYLHPYSKLFSDEFDFAYFRRLLTDRNLLVRNVIRFYLFELSEEEVDACAASNAPLFAAIKASGYSDEEKSRLYEFFIDPVPYIQTLEYELLQKELLLSAYYKDNYHKILDAHNNLTAEAIRESIKGFHEKNEIPENAPATVSFCLLNNYMVSLAYDAGELRYLLGNDYVSIVDKLVKEKNTMPLEDLCDALSETSRVQILRLMLEREELTCKDLEKAFQFSGSTAYHHITILTRAGAVKIRSIGKTICYSINRPFFDALRYRLLEFSNGEEFFRKP